MNRIDKDAFIGSNEIKFKRLESKIPVIRFATVVQIRGGEAIIRFAEDSQPSQKVYKALKSYIPEIGDRVQLIGDIIQGGWKP